MDQVNSYTFEGVYQELGIDIGKLGCIMLDIDNANIPPFKNVENLYENENGSVASGTPHATLLFGLMKTGTEWKHYVDEVLTNWSCKSVSVNSIGFFDSPKPEEPYYCIVAHLAITPELQAGHDRLAMLPHIDTFPGYKPHITIAYINKDPKIRDDVIEYYQYNLAGRTLNVTGLNYGDKPENIDKSMYCVSCRGKKEPQNLRPHQMKNGRQATRGECPDCGTGMFRIGTGA